DGIRDWSVTGVQTCALPISLEGLRRGLRTYIQFGIDNPNHYIVTFVQAKQLPPEQQSNTGEQCFDNLRAAVRRCVEAGQLNCNRSGERRVGEESEVLGESWC